MLNTNHDFEAELFKDYWQDGLLDLLFGAGLLTLGIGWWFHWTVFGAVAPAFVWMAWVPMRRRLVEPHAGYVEFSQARQARTRSHRWRTLLLGTFSFLLGIAVFAYVRTEGVDPRLVQIIPALPAVLLAIGAFVGAQFTGAQRFTVYGFMLLAGGLLTTVYGLGPAMPMLIGGPIVTASGGVLLIQFLGASARFEGDG